MMETKRVSPTNRWAFSCAIAVVVLSLEPAVRSTCAQSDRKGFTTSVWQLDSKGNLVRVVMLSGMQVVREDPLFALLRPAMSEELEIVPDQERDLRRLRGRMLKWREKATTSLLRLMSGDPKARATAGAMVAELEEERNTLVKDAKEILLPFQVRRIEELRCRHAILVSGWNADVIEKQFSEVAFEGGELRRAIGAVAGQKESLSQDFTRDYAELMEKTRETMGAGQWQRLVMLVGEPAKWVAPSYGIVVSQLDDVGRRVSRSSDVVRECAESASGFQSDISGAVTLAKYGSAAGVLLLAILPESDRYGNLRGLPGTGELVTPQEMELQKKQLEEKARRAMDLYQAGASQVEDLLKDFQEILADYSVWALEKQLKALDAESRAEYVRALRRRTVEQRGLHWCLVHGELGRAVGLSDSERTRLKELARDELSKWVAASRRQEDRLWSLFLAELSFGHRQQCKQKLGKSPHELPGLPMLSLAPAARQQ